MSDFNAQQIAIYKKLAHRFNNFSESKQLACKFKCGNYTWSMTVDRRVLKLNCYGIAFNLEEYWIYDPLLQTLRAYEKWDYNPFDTKATHMTDFVDINSYF